MNSSEPLSLNTAVNLQLVPGSTEQIKLIDGLEVGPHMRSHALVPYLDALWKSLCIQSDSREAGVHRCAFNEFIGLPGIISERLFNLIDRDHDGILKIREFQAGISRLFCSSFEDKVSLIFDLYDFNEDGYMSGEDIKTMLSHAPLTQVLEEQYITSPKEGKYTKSGGSLVLYLDRLQSQEELVYHIDKFMGEKATVTKSEFLQMTETNSSTIFLCLFMLIRTNCRIYKSFAEYCLHRSFTSAANKYCDSPNPVSMKLLPSPKLPPRTKLSPLLAFQTVCKQAQTNPPKPVSLMEKLAAKTQSKGHRSHLGRANTGSLPPKTSPDEDEKEKNKGSSTFCCTTSVISTSGSEKSSSLPDPTLFCSCGRPCEGTVPTQCAVCKSADVTIMHCGYLYEPNPDQGLWTRCWYRLIGKHLYRYESKQAANENAMMSLSGCFLRDEPGELIGKDKTMLLPFTLWMGEEHKKLYALKQEDKEAWLREIKQVLVSTNVTDFYEIKEVLGKGNYGMVRAAVHKETGERVAIKMLTKKNLNGEKLDLARREIEILKICQHSNITRLIDVFENIDYIYIVMELLVGKSLHSYMEAREYDISETRARNIIHSLATALYYMHSYGIVHRDLKLENVMMADESDDSNVKIVDFGLSKMIGPGELCCEPFGTFGYVAPEVLKGRTYGKAVDIWALGVISYMLLSGTVPFEAKTEEGIGKRTVFEEPSYVSGKWKLVSPEAQLLVQRMLVKDPEKRISLKEVLTHPWITDNCEKLELLRKNVSSKLSFKVFSQQEPNSLKMYDEVSRMKDRVSIS